MQKALLAGSLENMPPRYMYICTLYMYMYSTLYFIHMYMYMYMYSTLYFMYIYMYMYM